VTAALGRPRSLACNDSGSPVKVGTVLTAHKTVAMFMRYIHTEDAPVRQAAELAANLRKTVVAGTVATPVSTS
jgi:hypothetical protein